MSSAITQTATGEPAAAVSILEEEASGTPMVMPGVGMSMSEDHRYWFNGAGPRPSVTTILGIIDKGPGLMWWGRNGVAAAAVRYAPHLGHIVDWLGEVEAARWLAGMPDIEKGKAAHRGTDIHRYADMAARGVETGAAGFGLPEEYIPYAQAFQGYLARYSASSVVSSEHAIWSDDGYAGTYDLLQVIDGELWLIDIKTSKGIYPEFRLQLAAYGYADSIILPNDPKRYSMPAVQRYGILHLSPEIYGAAGWRLHELKVTDADYLAFLSAFELYKWREAHKT